MRRIRTNHGRTLDIQAVPTKPQGPANGTPHIAKGCACPTPLEDPDDARCVLCGKLVDPTPTYDDRPSRIWKQ